jgi:hypothetical protein
MLSPMFTCAAEYRLQAWTALWLSGYRQQNASVFNDYNYAVAGAILTINKSAFKWP